MDTSSLMLEVSETAGRVSAEYIVPPNPNNLMVLAHGAGAGMNHSFMLSLANALAAHGIATLRFNFPFIEQKKRRPDLPAIAHKTIAAAVDNAKQQYPGLPLWLSGKSFGGRMSSQYVAAHPNENITGIVFFGFPLHPPGKPSIERADHLKKVNVPMLFLQGSRDELAHWDLIEQVCGTLTNATLKRIEGADHAFKAGKQDIISLLALETFEWIKKQSQ